MKVSRKETLDSLKADLNTLISRYENLKAENLELKDKIRDLESGSAQDKAAIGSLHDNVKELEDRIERNNLGKAFTITAGDVRTAEAAIEELIREIDRCIGLIGK